jgi:hypothetical protein
MPTRVWRWVCLLLLVTLAACSTSGNKVTKTQPSIPDLRAALLAPRQLPRGYSTAPSIDSGIPPCNFERALTAGALRRVQASFGSATLGTTVFTELLVAQLSQRTRAVYSNAVERLKGCRDFDTGEGGIGRMKGRAYPFPSVGDASAGFLFVVTVGGVNVSQYLVVARFKGVVASFTGLGGGTAGFEECVKAATIKIGKEL